MIQFSSKVQFFPIFFNDQHHIIGLFVLDYLFLNEKKYDAIYLA